MAGRSRESCRRTARGFGALFWCLLWAMAGAAYADATAAKPAAALFLALAGYWPLGAWALRRLGRDEAFAGHRGLLRTVAALAVTTAGLSPMAVWWRLYPTNAFFACNTALYAGSGLLLLFATVRLVAAYGAGGDDRGLKGEADAATTALAFTLALCAAALWCLMRDLPDRSVAALMRHYLQIHVASRFCVTALVFGLVAYPVRLARQAAQVAADEAEA